MRYLLLSATALLATPAAAADRCAATHAFPAGQKGVEGVRVFKGDDGGSHLETVTYASKSYPFPGSSLPMTTTPLVASSKRPAMLVVAPPGLDVTPKPSPQKEVILLLDGSSTVTAGGQSMALKPGMFVVFDDAGAKDGHGGRIGPCGYVGMALFPE